MSYTKVTSSTVKVAASGSMFDTTEGKANALPGRHKLNTDPIDTAAFAATKPTEKVDPKKFLKRGGGSTATTGRAKPGEGGGSALSTSGKVTVVDNSKPKPKEALQRRANPPNTDFRKFYERGDLPVQVCLSSRVHAHVRVCLCVDWKCGCPGVRARASASPLT
jgi:hypothetical protein